MQMLSVLAPESQSNYLLFLIFKKLYILLKEMKFKD